MTILKQFYANGATVGTLTTASAGAGDDVFSAVNGATDVTIVASGAFSPRIKLVEAAAARNCRWDLSTPTATWQLAIDEYEMDALPSGGTAIFQVLDVTPTQIVRFQVGSTGTVTLYDTANAVLQASTSGLMSTGTKYRIVAWGDATGAVTVKVYLATGGAALTTLTGSAGNTSPASRFVWGSVASATCSGRYFDGLQVGNVAAEIPAIGTSGTVNRLVSNAGGFTNVGGAFDFTAALADASDTTYIESVTDPVNTVHTEYLARLNRADTVTVTVRAQATANAAISQKIEILDAAGTVLGTATNTLTTAWADYTVTTSGTVAAGAVLQLRITENAL